MRAVSSVLSLLAFQVLGVATSPGAFANTYSIVRFEGITQYGTYAEFHNNNMTVYHPDELQGAFILHGVWASSGVPCGGQYWIEAGVVQATDPVSNLIAYWHYVAKKNLFGYSEFLDAYTTPDGSNHSYFLYYTGDTAYWAYRDGVPKYGGFDFGYGTCRSSAGLESNIGPDGRTHSDTFDIQPLKWLNTSYQWQTGWPIYTTSINYPCGVYNPPFCYNGVHYNNSYWADNKPCHGYSTCVAP